MALTGLILRRLVQPPPELLTGCDEAVVVCHDRHLKLRAR
jgi:hypothetical protein